MSLTDRCNWRCVYGMLAAGLPWLPRADVLTDDEGDLRTPLRAGRPLAPHIARPLAGKPREHALVSLADGRARTRGLYALLSQGRG